MTFVVLNPTTIADTTMLDIPPTSQMRNCTMVEILNDTTFAMNVVIPGGVQSYMAPQTAKFFSSDLYYGDDIRIFPVDVMAGNFSGVPQKLTIIGFAQGDTQPPDGTTIDLSKTVFVGTAVTISGGGFTMNELQNDNNVAGTPILETTVQGQGTSNQTATNDGLWSLGVIIGGSIVKWLQTSVSDPIVKLGAVSHIIEALGALTVDQNLIVKGTTSLDNGAITTNGSGTITGTLNGNATTATTSASATTATNVSGSGTITAATETLTGTGTALTVNHNATVSGALSASSATVSGTLTAGAVSINAQDIVAGSGSFISLGSNNTVGNILDSLSSGGTYLKGPIAINFQVPDGTTVGQFTSAGAQLIGTGNKVHNDTLAGFSVFTGNMSASPTTFNHGLHTTPKIVLAVDTSGSGSINTYQCYNYTSTQVTMRSTFNGAGNPFIAIAIG